MTEVRSSFVPGHGGAPLAVHRIGVGRPVLLLHGLFATAQVNWMLYGSAARIAKAGFQVIMPDLRAHGLSDASHDPAAYPPDVLAKDVLALADALGLDDFDLGGFSIGSRAAIRAVLAGLRPRRLLLGGIGLEGLVQWSPRNAFFINTIDNIAKIKPSDPRYLARQLIRTMKVDVVAVRLLLGAEADTDVAADELPQVTMPTLVLCGVDDHSNGSGPRLAEALPRATYSEVPGGHLTSLGKRQFGNAIEHFLAA